ncbi:MAG TPA: metalloregulator ArsR/SmtB family transcription factor [Dongiaceae bacterium]|nr:metalloregulator ArsR/SmtB family transcription factor [Dongiaceae bacterium]
MKRERIEQISKALGDETRLRIFEAISSAGEMNCGQLVSMRDVTPATVSHHLKILHDAGLIRCRKEGQFVYSEPNPTTLAEYARAVTRLSKRAKKKAMR